MLTITSAATFRCAGREVLAEYLGRQRWRVHAVSEPARFETNESTGRALREALGLVPEPAFNTRAIEVQAPRGMTASIKNNTFPTSCGSTMSAAHSEAWPGDAARNLVKQLAAAGHGLDSFDEDEGFARWLAESSPRNVGKHLVVEAYYAPYRQPTVLVTVRNGEVE